MVGGRLGFGHPPDQGRPASFFALVVTRTWDDPSSLPVDTTLPPNAPTAGGLAPVNPYAVTPHENLVVAGIGGISLLEGRLAWRGEVAGALETPDRRATPLDPSQVSVPGILGGLVTPRVSTHLDYAYSSDLQLRMPRLPGATPGAPRTLTATLGYRYVGPGYSSLGVASLPNDIEAVNASANLLFGRCSAQLLGGTQHDNLIGQKLYTTTRDRLGAVLTLRAGRKSSTTVRTSVLTMGNGSTDSLAWMHYSAWSLGASQVFSLGPRGRVQTVSVDYNYQSAGDANPLRIGTKFGAHSGSARLTVPLGSSVRISPSFGFTTSQSDTSGWATRATFGAAVAWRGRGGRLTSTGSFGRSTYLRSNAWNVTLNARLQVTDLNSLVLAVQSNRFRDAAALDNRFNEQIVSLRWERRL